MDKIILQTESYLIIGKDNERFLPFLELEFNETVIYENDVPKYFLSFSEDLKEADGIGNWIMEDLEKNGHKLRDFIVKLGEKFNLKWDIFSSHVGNQVDSSYLNEEVELELFTDKTIEKLKIMNQNR